MNKLLLALFLVSTPALAAFTVPELPNPVNDYANVLTPQGKETAASKVIELKKNAGVQLGVLIVDTLDGTDIETAAQAVAQKWKLGRKSENKGLLFLLAVSDRKSRIEVGYGLEGQMTDAASKRILASIRSYLRNKDYDGAVLSAIDKISAVVSAPAETPPTAVTPTTDEGLSVVTWLLVIIGLIGFGAFVVNLIRKAKEASEQEEKLSARIRTYEPRTETRNAYVPLPVPVYSSRNDDDDSSSRLSKSRSSDDSSSSFGSSWSSSDSSSSSSSSDSGSSWGGGGGDFGGGGSSDSW